MIKKENNYAFIDGQNLYHGIRTLGWNINWKKFRIYLMEKYQVSKAFIFIGYIESNQKLYDVLSSSGFILIFKPTIADIYENIKGNCDADLVLNVLIGKLRQATFNFSFSLSRVYKYFIRILLLSW